MSTNQLPTRRARTTKKIIDIDSDDSGFSNFSDDGNRSDYNPTKNIESDAEGEGNSDYGPSSKTNALHSGKTVEEIYQKKTQIEHILLRPDTYIGSVEFVTEKLWVYDSETDSMVYKDVTIVPGLYKIVDEILVNAADNKIRDPSMSTIK
ncbi:15673_t:CDS:2, partial [Dentiscutata erythropus]